jgi:hypothetical protein
MNSTVDGLIPFLSSILTRFANRVVAVKPTLHYDLGTTKNDAFVLRAYLSLRQHDDGDEVAVTVDMTADSELVTVVCDVCTDAGDIIALGPVAKIPWANQQFASEDIVTVWLDDFDRFLHKVEADVLEATSTWL